VVRVVLVGHGQPNMVRVEAKVVWSLNLAFGQHFPACFRAVLVDFAHGATLNPCPQTTPEPVPIMPRVMSFDKGSKFANFAFCPIVSNTNTVALI